MSPKAKRSRSPQRKAAAERNRPLYSVIAALAVVGIFVAGYFAVAAYKDSAATYPPTEVPVFDSGTMKELTFGKKPLAMVLAVDEDGNIQAFRAPGTKAFTAGDLAERPLKADSIAAFRSLSIIKTTNPKICWTGSDGTVYCITY